MRLWTVRSRFSWVGSIEPYPVDFRVCNALKIKPFQILLRNIPFCSLGEVGGAGAEPPQNLPTAAEVVQTVLTLEWNGRRTGIVFRNWVWYNFSQNKPKNWDLTEDFNDR